MNSYSETLEKLQTAIVLNQPALALSLLGRKTPSLPARLDAYIHGYRIRLSKAVTADYSALHHYLRDAFDSYVKAYVEATPSHSYTIDQYPLGFAVWLAQHSDNLAASDLATLESAIAEVFWLADSEVFVPHAEFSEDTLPTLTLRPRHALKLLALAHDVETYLQSYRNGTPDECINYQPTFLAVVRHHNEIKRHVLSAAQYALLNALYTQPFGIALEQTLSQHPEYGEEISISLGGWLHHWICSGLFRKSEK